jgi:hypothetical protein
MKKLSFLIALPLFLIYGCSEESITPNDSSSENYTQQDTRSSNRVIHHASVGSNDACEAFGNPPGCDGNFSLVANMREDGTVKGQWNDTFAGGGEGIHVTIDCMIVDGNSAIVGGYITHGSDGVNDLTGLYAVTAVWDNGTSNNDPDDQISFSYFSVLNPLDPAQACDYVIGQFVQLDLTRGQVKVR